MISNIPTDRFNLLDKKNAKIFYKKNGYVILKNFYSKDILQDFKNEVVNIINSYLIKAKLKTIETSQERVLTDGIAQLEKYIFNKKFFCFYFCQKLLLCMN